MEISVTTLGGLVSSMDCVAAGLLVVCLAGELLEAPVGVTGAPVFSDAVGNAVWDEASGDAEAAGEIE